MDNWTAGDYLALAALVVAVVGIPVALWGTRRWGERRARLLVTYRSVPLLPVDDARQLLKVTYRDFEVPAPHLLTVSLRNVGSRDIASDRFDQGRPLRIDLNAKMYGVVSHSLRMDGMAVETAAIGADNGYISFQPSLLGRDHEWTVEVIVSGTPSLEVTSSLVDTDLVVANAESAAAGAALSRAIADALFGSIPGIGEVLRAATRR